MRISKESVKKMIELIVSEENYGSGGHHCSDDEATQLVKKLGLYVKESSDFLYIPKDVMRWITNSVLDDIILGMNRPLHYLCSDCRYPKWCMTLEEAKKYCDNEKYVEKNKRHDGFVNISDACPKCGD